MKNNYNLSVFVIDDDPMTRFLHRRTVESLGIDVFYNEANDGRKALELMEEIGGTLPDLILLDINMPVMDGFQFMKEYKKLPGSGHTQIIIVSSSQCEVDVKIGLMMGADNYVQKPISKSDLRLIIAEVLIRDFPAAA